MKLQTLVLLILLLGKTAAANERFHFDVATGSTNGGAAFCSEAIAFAQQECYEKIEAFSEEHEITGEPSCRPCSCDGGVVGGTPAACLVAIAWDDDQAHEGKTRTKFISASDSSFGCPGAIVATKTMLHRKMAAFAKDHVVTDYFLNRCQCGGHPISQASCSATVQYLQVD